MTSEEKFALTVQIQNLGHRFGILSLSQAIVSFSDSRNNLDSLQSFFDDVQHYQENAQKPAHVAQSLAHCEQLKQGATSIDDDVDEEYEKECSFLFVSSGSSGCSND